MGMPRAVAKDQRWLPAIGRRVPFAVPEPVGLGVPTPEFERPWSVYRWIEGVPAGEAVIAGLDDFAQPRPPLAPAERHGTQDPGIRPGETAHGLGNLAHACSGAFFTSRRSTLPTLVLGSSFQNSMIFGSL